MIKELNNSGKAIGDLLSRFPIQFIILACIITRLPQLLAPHLILDPDECVTATMAKHLLLGTDFSLFFWGQNYGFTFFESLSIVPFYLAFGVTTLSVKLAMLSIWTVGVVFLYRTLLQLSPQQSTALCLSVVFICLPAWATWSMKARGGYLSSFALSSVLLYFLFYPKWEGKHWKWLIIGILFQFIVQCQFLWVIGLLPLIIFMLFKEGKLSGFLIITITVILTGFLFKEYTKNIHNVYNVYPAAPKLNELPRLIERFPDFLYSSFHGHYYFSKYQAPDPAGAFVSGITVLSLLSLVFLSFRELFFNKLKDWLFIFSTAFIWGFFFFSFFMFQKEGRYFLPMPGFIILSFAIYFQSNLELQWHKIAKLIAIAGIAALNTFWHFEFEPTVKPNLNELIKYLNEKNIKYVFSREYMLPWHLTFYSNEQIIARIPYKTGRYQPFHTLVDSNYFANGKTAIIGEKWNLPKWEFYKCIFVNDYYYVMLNPTDTELKQHFEFNGSDFKIN